MSFTYRLSAAPMAGISNRAWREVAHAHGADLAYGEMISTRALCFGNTKTFELMDIEGELAPRLVQISGADPRFVAEAAKTAASLGAQIIDLNMGCPVPKVVKNNEGSMLMCQPELASELVSAAKAAGLPVTCKIRAGWDDGSRNAAVFAERLERAGVAFIAVHGRTRQQFYGGQADWEVIAEVKRAVGIPVIGNGDIFTARDALHMLEQTGCDGVMAGRGMLGNPWLFDDIKAVLAGHEPPGRPPAEQIAEQALAQLKRHIERSIYWIGKREGESKATSTLGEELAVRSMRSQLGWYTKGLRNSAELRRCIHLAVSYREIAELFTEYLGQTTE